ncbi:MAG TPA: type II toxin-antitoxin system death-on-curing family toxin [Lacipirellulaceae bacterium]|nr:type II toxin-antitoxin system death-on-curing family toxin [Lacipirellulaceae bacterium]
MAEPRFLNLEAVHRLHALALAAHGGLDGVRDPGLVESALASAQNTWWYGGGDVFNVAAAYAFQLAESQAFLDGNKRTGLLAAETFLVANGFRPPGDDLRLYEAMIAISARRLDKPALAALFRSLFTPIPT